MGLATIEPHSQKERTKIHKNPQKIPKFDVSRVVLTEIQPFKTSKLTKTKMFGHPDIASGWPYIFFINFDIFKWLYLAY